MIDDRLKPKRDVRLEHMQSPKVTMNATVRKGTQSGWLIIRYLASRYYIYVLRDILHSGS